MNNLWYRVKFTLWKMKEHFEDEEGMGTVEIILIILVLIGLVIIFKQQIKGLVETILGKITSQANSI